MRCWRDFSIGYPYHGMGQRQRKLRDDEGLVNDVAERIVVGSTMILVAFLPQKAAESLRRFVAGEKLVLAQSWREVESLLRVYAASVLILDPAADGSMNVGSVIDLMRKFPATPTVAYVSMTGPNLKAVLELSRYGLSDAIVHSPNEPTRQLSNVLNKASIQPNVSDVLGWMERSLAELPPSVTHAMQDLFERPHRYETAADIALQGGVSTKALYRTFQAVQLNSPRKFLVVAKLLRGYTLMRDSGVSARSAAARVGYTRPANFSRHCVGVFGLRPRALRNEPNREEVVRALLDWLCKPPHALARRIRQ